jgi:hypothetical protein
VDFCVNSNAKIPINQRAADLQSDGDCRVKNRQIGDFRGFKREAQQTPRFQNGLRSWNRYTIQTLFFLSFLSCITAVAAFPR